MTLTMPRNMTRDQAFGELRSFMAQPPSEHLFTQVLLFLATLPFERDYLENIVVPYLLESFKRWPKNVARPLYWSKEIEKIWGEIPSDYSSPIFSLVDMIYLTPGRDSYIQENFSNVTTLRAYGSKTAPALLAWDWQKVTALYLQTNRYDNALLKQVLSKGRDTLLHLTLYDDGTSKPFRLNWLKVVPNLKTLSLDIPMANNGITSVLNKLPPTLEKLTIIKAIPFSAWEAAVRNPSTSFPETLKLLEVNINLKGYQPWSKTTIKPFKRLFPKHVKIAYL